MTHGAPHHLVADSALRGGPFEVRRTRAGDAWPARRSGDDGHEPRRTPAPDGPVVLLGMPAARPLTAPDRRAGPRSTGLRRDCG